VRPPADSRRGRTLRRGAYLLPSLFTIGNILLGFFAIVLGLRSLGLVHVGSGELEPQSHFAVGALLIFAAGILDGLDGRIARLTGTESEFGKQFDSLADVLTFGLAPALLAYLWGLHEWGRMGWLVPFLFLTCTATRLARFNVQTRVVDSRFFVGLPTPAAAGGICSILFYAPHSEEWKTWMQGLMFGALLILGLLMVSTFRYHSFKKLDLRRRWSYRASVPIAVVLLVIAFEPRATLLAITALFTLSGPFGWLIGRFRPRQSEPAEPPAPPLADEAP
jgi:CDP-diacylglycerol--serine O-phosphatidyltransferase